MSSAASLSAEKLRHSCNPDELSFETTRDLDDIDVALGQERALSALEFGVGIENEGYNLYVLGSSSVDLRAVVGEFLGGAAKKVDPPSDWCYVHNFDDPRKPLVLELATGKGRSLEDDMAELVKELQVAIPAAFESEEYQSRHAEIEQQVQQRQGEAFQELQKEAEEKGMGVIQTPQGFAIAPIHDDHVLTKEEFDQLPEEEQQKTESTIQELSEKLRAQLRAAPLIVKEARQAQKELDRQTALVAIAAPMAGLKEKWRDQEDVLRYLDRVSEDLLENVSDFRPQSQMPQLAMLGGGGGGPSFTRYEVNLLVDNAERDGAPVVYETNPTYLNLIGRIEHVATFGALTTDFTLIKPGALHRANGGFLVLDVDRLLAQPYAWQGLQRALLARELRIEPLDRVLSLTTTVTLEPEPIPLDLKVVLVGSRLIYYLMSEYVPEFPNLFKIPADFDDEIERTPETVTAFARLIATLARRDDLLPLDRGAVARVIDDLSRRVSDARKLSIGLSDTADLLRESSYLAARAGADVVATGHVDDAVEARRRRLDRIPKRVLETIERDILLIDTEGEAVGQINGLSVLSLGQSSFGHPTRITATARLGKGELIDVQREVKLGGSIHSKGVFILGSFLGARYARDIPLSLSASLVFEQTYAQVDGDSASIAETCALLSTLADLPLRQDLAVTGSMNQLGRVQAVGGVNEKIEGFFEVCRKRGLTGEQGVLLPVDNVQHLMLRTEVVEAVRGGKFHVYPVRTLDEALELMTGRPAGEPDDEGRYPDDTVNGRVQARLQKLAELARQLAVERKEALGDAKPAS